MNSKFTFILCFFINISFSTQAQSLDELINLHYNNLEALNESRGFKADWIETGQVNQADLIKSLNNYGKNVGLMICSHENDTLIITLINKYGNILTDKQFFSKDCLIHQINKANKRFSSYFSRPPVKRGANPETIRHNKPEFQEAFENINNNLLPFKDSLINFDHLIIVPTLNISTLPFAAFKISEDKYLIDVMSYSIAPSLFELMVSKEININQGIKSDQEVYYTFENSLFVANPEYPKDMDRAFPNLPGTLKEVNFITNSFDRSSYKLLSGENATIHNIMDDICGRDLLYFATHGISDSKNPLDSSFLVLAKDSAGKAFLTARDIQNIRKDCKLNADLVILSACQTGLGKEHDGGIIGLARAFQIAGANHVIMSLWNINDKETATLMAYFFDFLKEADYIMPHAALRKAILKYKNEINDNPNIWASFSIFGVPY